MNPSTLIVDTSVFASATLFHEDYHQDAKAFMRMVDARQVETLVPALLLPEIMSALQRNRYPLARRAYDYHSS